ncbi:MAG TPA: hypothetical protein VGG06_16570 [Thermoanaerobaculia bacterium]
MYGNQRYVRQPIGFGGGGPFPQDLWVLLGVLLFTYSLYYFETTASLLGLLQLSPNVWRRGYVWQLATYAFVAQKAGPIWFVISVAILFFFGRDVFRVLGRRHFWRLILWAAMTASVVAVLVQILMWSVGWMSPAPFLIMQGSSMLLTILVAAFATLYGNATILLMFVIPVQARWFLWLEILFAFLAFLPTKDFAGFVGVCVAVGTTYSILTSGSLRRALREYRLRLERRILEARMQRRRRRFKVVKKDDDVHRGPWVN